VPYAPGTLEARGYARASWWRATPRDGGAPAALRLVTERTRLAADGDDLAAVRVDVVDGHAGAHGRHAAPFAVTGAARLIGLGNGNPTSTEPDKGTTRRAFNGLAQALVQGPARWAAPGSPSARRAQARQP
jgi:beta-galactosidase